MQVIAQDVEIVSSKLMSNKTPDQLIDQRNPGFFIVDDEVIDNHGAKIGPLGLAVYNVLVKHANKFGTSCFPSYQTIADKLGISRNSAMKGVDILITEKLVHKVTRTDDSGAPASNNYKILPVKKSYKQVEKKHDEVVQNLNHPPDLSDSGSANSAPPSSNIASPLVQIMNQGSANSAPDPDPLIQTHLNQTHTHTVTPAARAPANGNGRNVCVCSTPHKSKLCDEERIQIARNMIGVNSPERYAMTLEARRGTYDATFLKRQKELKKPGAVHQPDRDTSACPDCAGTNFWYPMGKEKGVAKCQHLRLDEASLYRASTKTAGAHMPLVAATDDNSVT